MKENQLTIVIPTYNRKERLLNQLDRLLQQDVSKSIKIIIVDNHSNYDVKEAVWEKYSKTVFSNVEINVRPFNIGLGAAITMPFLLCKTDWLWILGDDDELEGDLNKVLKDLKLYNDYAYLKYNISNSSPQEDKDIATIEDFLSYYGNKKHSTGDLVFISNSLFNLSLLKQYLGLSIMWSNTLIGHLIPVIFGLSELKIKCRMIDYDLVKYKAPPQGTGYGHIWVTLGISLIGDIEFPVSQKLNEKIYQLVQYDCSHLKLLNAVMKIENRYRRKYVYDRIYSSCYHLGFKNKLIRILFYCSQILRINFAKYLLKAFNTLFDFIYLHMPSIKDFIKRKFPDNYMKFKFW